MAVSNPQSPAGFSNTGAVSNANYTVPGGLTNSLLICYRTNRYGTGVGPTLYNGVTLDVLVSPGGFSGIYPTALHYMVNPPAGLHTLTWGNYNTHGGILAFVVDGVDQVTPIGDFDNDNGSSGTSNSKTVDGAVTGDLIISTFSSINQSLSPTPALGQTLIHSRNSFENSQFASYAAASSSVTMTWTWTGSTVTHHIAFQVRQASASTPRTRRYYDRLLARG